MVHATYVPIRIALLAAFALLGTARSQDAAAPAAKTFPLWDGKETIADYAKRAGLDAALALDLGGGVKLELVLVPAGKFRMGSEEDDEEKPVHEVTIPRPFYMGKFPVTQAHWLAVMGNWPSEFKGLKDPVEGITWDEIEEFRAKVAAKTGKTVRLPTEAEREYACRAGSATAYCFGNDALGLGEYAWYDANSNKTHHPAGEKKPNAWGLYDMHGNVWEWCQGWHAAYRAGPVTDGPGAETGAFRVLRGGAWNSDATHCRSAFRLASVPSLQNNFTGFRVVVAPAER